jgi:large subunit ribosomal protein L17
MRHKVKKGKLGLKTGHRISLLRNLCTELFRYGRITTTDAKAKELRKFSEKIITLAKNDTVHSRRLVNTKIKDREVMTKLFDTIGPSFSNRPGGYTRIIKLNYRKGDAAPVSSIELVGLDVPFKPKDDGQDEANKTKVQKPG